MNVFLEHIDKIQLIFIFINSFLLSRLIIVAKIPERLVLYLIGKKHLSIIQIVFYVILVSAFLSFFIPNVITVLTLLPVTKILCRTFEESLPDRYRAIETVFPLAIIYGANIGGMGSITGTPANGILVLYATFHHVHGTEYLSFEFWLLWGIPLVIAFIFTAWLVLAVCFRLWSYNNDLVHVVFREDEAFHPLQRVAVISTVLFFLISILFSILIKTSPDKLSVFVLTGFSTLLLILLLFFIPFKISPEAPPQRLLTLRECYSNLPFRGIAFVGIILVAIWIGSLFHLQDSIIHLFSRVRYLEIPGSLLNLVIAALTSFSTEIFSNTVVQLAMFSVVTPMFDPTTCITIQALIVITLSSTCAFMTPIATGVNGLAFGEMRGMSLTKMLAAGFAMKIIGVTLIAFMIQYGVGWLF